MTCEKNLNNLFFFSKTKTLFESIFESLLVRIKNLSFDSFFFEVFHINAITYTKKRNTTKICIIKADACILLAILFHLNFYFEI